MTRPMNSLSKRLNNSKLVSLQEAVEEKMHSYKSENIHWVASLI